MEGEPPRLFDLSADPVEAVDRARERPERVARLRAQLEAWRARHPPEVDGAETLRGVPESTERRLRALGYAH